MDDEIKETGQTESPQKNTNNAWVIAGSIVAAGIIIALAVFSMGRGSSPDDKTTTGSSAEPLAIGDAPVLGDPNAPYTIVEFGDFQCIYCSLLHKEMDKKIRDAFISTGKAKMVFKTLSFVGQESVSAGLAGECAKEQGKFWDMHDAIFDAESAEGENAENSGNLTKEFFITTAKKLGLNENQFTTCYDSKKGQVQLDSYQNDMIAAGIQGTPTVFIDGKQIQNPFELSQYSDIIK